MNLSRTRRRPVAALTVMTVASWMIARAAVVRVVDEADQPVADVMVACMNGSRETALTESDGRAVLPDGCREAYCERGDLLPDRTTIAAGRATCRLRTGAVITVVADEKLCPEGCFVSVVDAAAPDAAAPDAPPAGSREPVLRRLSNGWIEGKSGPFPAVPGRTPQLGRWTSKPLTPAHLKLSVSVPQKRKIATDTTWQCETDLGVVGAGKTQEAALWRPPLEVAGRVLDRQGKPVSGVPLFVRPLPPAPVSGTRVWTCSARDRNAEPMSGADGSFRLRIDPEVDVVIEAGWKNYPLGTASATVHGKPEAELVLELQ